MSETYSVQDRELLLKKIQELDQSFRQEYGKWENTTLKEYIMRYAEVFETCIDAGVYPELQVQDISSHLFRHLNENGISVSDRHIRRILPPKYKRNYQESDIMSDLSKSDWVNLGEVGGFLIERDQNGNFRINGIEQKAIEPKDPKQEKQNPLEKIVDRPVIKFLNSVLTSSNMLGDKLRDRAVELIKTSWAELEADEIADLSYRMIKKYADGDEETRKIIDQQLDQTQFKDMKEIQAKITKMTDDLDERIKTTEFEKMKAHLMYFVTNLGIAGIAGKIAEIKHLNDFSPKHVSNEIMRDVNPSNNKRNTHLDGLDYFDRIEIPLTKSYQKGDILILNARDWWDENLKRMDLGLDYKQPVTEYIKLC